MQTTTKTMSEKKKAKEEQVEKEELEEKEEERERMKERESEENKRERKRRERQRERESDIVCVRERETERGRERETSAEDSLCSRFCIRSSNSARCRVRSSTRALLSRSATLSVATSERSAATTSLSCSSCLSSTGGSFFINGTKNKKMHCEEEKP